MHNGHTDQHRGDHREEAAESHRHWTHLPTLASFTCVHASATTDHAV